MTHTMLLETVFQALDLRVQEANTGSIVLGFWRSSSPLQLVPDLDEAGQTARKHGFWTARAMLPGTRECPAFQLQLMVSLLGGRTMIGLYIPDVILDGQAVSGAAGGMREAVSSLYDGRPATIERRIGADTLYDWVFEDPPFTAQWLLESMRETEARSILENRLLWAAMHLWEGVKRLVGQYGNQTLPVFADEHISPELAEYLGLSVADRLVMPEESIPGRWGRKRCCITIVGSSTGYLSQEVMDALAEQLPGCRFECGGDSSEC